MFKFSAEIKGLPSVILKTNAVVAKIGTALRVGLAEGGLMVAGAAQRRAPVETGNLKASAALMLHSSVAPDPPEWQMHDVTGRIVRTDDEIRELDISYSDMVSESADILSKEEARNNPTVTVGFGAYYALRNHEAHKTKSKFLEKAVAEQITAVVDRIGARLREVL